MQRYFVAPEDMTAEQVIIRGEDAFHLIRVMRATIGTQVIVSNGQGKDALAAIHTLQHDQVQLSLVREELNQREPKVPIWIAQSLPKADKFELVIQKCTEIGASAFIPFTSTHTVVQYDPKQIAKRMERWQKIAKEAAEQAHRSVIPKVHNIHSWKQLMSMTQEVGCRLFCYEKPSAKSLKLVLSENRVNLKHPILVMVGPEGGFSDQEAADAEAAGWTAVSLGARILRTETAAMLALGCVLYEFDDI
jgi:16S rRNA (uracil1498-N3)-methyltransferase